MFVVVRALDPFSSSTQKNHSPNSFNSNAMSQTENVNG